MVKKLIGKRITIVATDGFEQSELLDPQKALEDAGAKVDVIAVKGRPDP
jgi:protease I